LKPKLEQIPLIPQDILSVQQKQIYKLYCQGLSNKKIAEELNLEQRSVATQLSRIRKKAANLGFTYKIEQGAEYAQYQVQQDSPADELKKKIQNDPGFFKLMFNRYGKNENSQKENSYRFASTGQDTALLLTVRAKQVKTIVVSSKGSSLGRIAVKMGKDARKVLGDYLYKQKIKPLQTYWDDGSAVYLVTPGDFKKMQQQYNQECNNQNL
jgi:DNA-binding CsgD family transcriptional regulator